MADLKNVAPLADFDWDAYESGDAANVSREEQQKAYEGSLNKVNDHEVVDGTVIAMNKREVVVNIGFKSDGIIPMSEFRYNPDLKVGDKVEVYIENQEDKKGQLILSHKKARATRSWDRVNEALEKEEIIKGYIKCRTKGGMIVDVFGIEAFLPGSQIDEERNYRQTGKRPGTRRYCQEYHLLRCVHRPGWRRRFDPHHRPFLGPRKRSA